MDKTYAETKGAAPFDWRKALENPPQIKSEEHDDLRIRSNSWVTCACGNQCAILPRGEHAGEPEDNELAGLGAEFHIYVSAGEWTSALRVLDRIEHRASFLIPIELARLNAELPSH